MIRKNVSETAHDEYIQHINDLLREANSLTSNDITRRGKDIGFFSKYRFEYSANRR